MTRSKRRDHGDGAIDARGPNTYRLRYRVDGKRYTVTFHGSISEARTELRRLIRTGDVGEHVAPDRMRLRDWIDRWLALLERKTDSDGAEVAPIEGTITTTAGADRKRRRGLVSPKTAERYAQLLRLYVLPTLGDRPLQQLTGSEIDALYVRLEETIAPSSVLYVHRVLKPCLDAAVRKRVIPRNPVADAEAPSPGETSAGMVLDMDQLGELVRGFCGTSIYLIVAVAAFTGMRRGEILALRWSDLDTAAKTLRIERAVEETKAYRRQLKEPKTARGKRTIQIDDQLLALLLAERDKHLRLVSGVPDGVDVDLSLVRLPNDALIFPSLPSLSKLRDLSAITRGFARRARRLGFAKLRFHDLRGSHETILLEQGVPVHVVAARCGHDPAVLLRTYAKRTRKADTSAAAVIGALSKGILGAGN